MAKRTMLMLMALAAASAGPTSSTEMPCGARSRTSDTISALPRSGEMWPT